MAKVLAIIPARGGSKRIPRKNIKSFCGKPIIAYSIQAAIESNAFTEVMVSTDDQEIAEVAKQFGAVIPFFRSKENSNDFAGTVEVLLEVLDCYKKLGKTFDYVCCIYPTAPLVTSKRLVEGMNTLQSSGADVVLPVMRFGYPIQRSLKIENGRAQMFWPENYSARSQDLTPAYHDCGMFYCLSVKSLYAQKKLFAAHTVPILLNEFEAQDIDNEEDWRIAELKFQRMHS